MCNRLHLSAAACTSSLSYDIFGSNVTSDNTACSYIESLRFGTYDEEGRLYNEAVGSSTNRQMTSGQKWGLFLSLLLCAVLALYSCYLHHSITNLLIRSLTHTDLLPSSRSRQQSIARRSQSSRRHFSDEDEEDWEQVARVKSHRRSSRSRSSRRR